MILPLFGGISVYGGASVLGVPFALALLGRNQVIVLSALSLIGAMGSYIPPVAFTPVVTAGLLGEPYMPIVRRCLGPAVAAVDPRHAHPDLREPDREAASECEHDHDGLSRHRRGRPSSWSWRSCSPSAASRLKINAGLVLIPLILRALMVDPDQAWRPAATPSALARDPRAARLPRSRPSCPSYRAAEQDDAIRQGPGVTEVRKLSTWFPGI
ncbi:MAG: hypothetical protein MZV49_25135 [Rhodopseudomonas palustris]|nr:hypothetical protein [Rhodopseudomonas palustris]